MRTAPLFSLERAEILEALKQPSTISQLSEKLSKDRKTIRQHLIILKKKGLVKQLHPEKKAKGKPTKWDTTSKAKPLSKAELTILRKAREIIKRK